MKTKILHHKADALLQAHVAHTIQQIQNFEVIHAEVAAFFEQMTETPLSTLISLENIQRIAKDRVLDIAPSHQLRTEIANVVKDALKNSEGKNTLLTDLIPDATADAVINIITHDTARRNAIIHEIFGNPTTGEVLSTTISHAIKDYMENNVVTKRIPGAAGLMKFGKGVLEKATDSNFDDALQNYLTRNIRNIITISEKKTTETLSDQKMHRIADDLWKKYKTRSMASLAQWIDAPTVDLSSHLTTVVWNHIRTTPYVQSIVSEGITGWYARNSNRSLVELLADVNVTPDFIVAEIEPVLGLALKHLEENGYLKSRIEPLLRQFYTSDAAVKIMAE